MELVGHNQIMPPTGSHMIAVDSGGSDWREVRFLPSALLVGTKVDGTLWVWARDYFGGRGPSYVPPSVASRYGSWMAITDSTQGFLALATDGTLCEWQDPNIQSIHWHDPRNLLGPSRIKARRIATLSR